ncbi:hypothetical protein ACP70R_042050 [Stipagrostis hirtigluma subsp. patula]
MGALPRRRRQRAEHQLLQCVGRDIFIFSIVVFFLAEIYKRLTTPATDQLCRSPGEHAGDEIVPCTPELFEGSIVVASGAAILGGGYSGSSLMTRLTFNVERKARGWSNTFRLDCSELGRPIGRVTRARSWEACLGRPIKQREKDACVIYACTVGVEARHRFKYAKDHGDGEHFPWNAAEPERLLEVCRKEGIWMPGRGANVGRVLDMIKYRGGVPVANPAAGSPLDVLQLSSWEEHSWDGGPGLSPQRVAELLDGGPCVGRLWTCPWYGYFDASLDDGAWVYRGCGRSEAARQESKRLYRAAAVSHAVVCFGYRFCGDQMHVLVLDNHQDTGPRRWVDVEEMDALYTLNVDYDPLLCLYARD